MTDVQFAALLIFVFATGFVVFFRAQIRDLLPRLSSFHAGGTRTRASAMFTPRETTASAGGTDAPEQAEAGSIPSDLAESKNEERAVDLAVEEDVAKLREAAIDAVIAHDQSRADHALSRLQEVGTPREVKLAEAWIDTARFHVDKDLDALARLKKKTEDAEVKAAAESMVGFAMEVSKRPAEAAEAFKRAAEAATDPKAEISAIASRSRVLAGMGRVGESLTELKYKLKQTTNLEERADIWEAMAEVFKAQEDYVQQGGALIQVLSARPNDSDLHFNIGYALSQADRPELSPAVVHHYRAALYFDADHSWALNNLGFQLEELGLPMEAVKYLKKAADVDNNLARLNMGHLYRDAGFAEEANLILSEAEARDDGSYNVSSSVASVVAERKGQSERTDELSSEGERIAEFLGFVQASAVLDPPNELEGEWIWGDGTPVELELGDSELRGTWTLGKAKHRFIASLSGRSGSMRFSEMQYWTWQGKREERDWSERAKGFLVVGAEGRSIKALRIQESRPPTLQELSRR